SRWLLSLFFSVIILFICAIFYKSNMNNHPGLVTIPVIIASTGCILFGNSKILGSLIRNNLMVFIGITSYSIYLIHWPIIVFYKYVVLSEEINFHGGLIILLLTLITGVTIYKTVENKYRKINSLRNTKNLLSLLIICSVTYLLGLYVVKNKEKNLKK
ncbi:acyltransferase family protein, partial [Xenorhabdus szentirmaii]|uniref:acyltransferase family protein n=1 Tax=Xenorhabdus szentirmaii TaxID=290112 RepID=UPI002B40103D